MRYPSCMSDSNVKVVTRFAPSPSGHLHIGGARTALFCWAYARHHAGAGRFLVRLEDTDRARSSEASARAILEDLAWLGIAWDEGPELEPSGPAPGGTALQSRARATASEHGSGELCYLGGDPRGVGPFRQSERTSIYDAHIERLIEQGKAYPAFEGPEELEQRRKAALAEKRQYRYDRAALQLREEDRMERMRRGEPHVVRIKTPDEPVAFRDEVLGDVGFAPGEIDDFIIRKRDGFPTYHFAVVVDDALMGVTHVLRGQEHLNNTPRHIILQRALGFPTPAYAHMPLIFNERGAKMSKRERDQAAREAVKAGGWADKGEDGKGRSGESPTEAIEDGVFRGWLADTKLQLEPDQLEALARSLDLTLPEVSVEDFRAAGYFPEVITNFIALLGWTPSKHEDGSDREKFDMEFLARDFDLGRIGRTNARFDRTKLAAFNQDAIAEMDDGAFAARWRRWAERYDPTLIRRLGDRWDLAARAARPRCKVLRDARGVIGFALQGDTEFAYDEKAVKKGLRKGEPSGLAVLGEIRPVLEGAEDWSPEGIETAIGSWCAEREIGMGKAAQPLRVAVTGGMVSPGLGETLALVGREGVLRRIDRCVEEVGATAE